MSYHHGTTIDKTKVCDSIYAASAVLEVGKAMPRLSLFDCFKITKPVTCDLILTNLRQGLLGHTAFVEKLTIVLIGLGMLVLETILPEQFSPSIKRLKPG